MDIELKGKRFSGLTIAGFVLAWFTGPIGAILSAAALSEIEHNPETLRGTVLARFGVAIGVIFMLGCGWLAYDHHQQELVDRANAASDQAIQRYYEQHRN